MEVLRRLIVAALLFPFVTGSAFAERTTIRRAGSGEGGNNGSAAPAGGGAPVSIGEQRTTIRRSERPSPPPATGERHWTADPPPRRSRGVGRDGHAHRIYPGASGGGSPYRERGPGTSVGVGRTRLIRRADAGPAPERHDAIARNTTIIRNMERHRRTEIVPDRDYWHNVNGHRFTVIGAALTGTVSTTARGSTGRVITGIGSGGTTPGSATGFIGPTATGGGPPRAA